MHYIKYVILTKQREGEGEREKFQTDLIFTAFAVKCREINFEFVCCHRLPVRYRVLSAKII